MVNGDFGVTVWLEPIETDDVPSAKLGRFPRPWLWLKIACFHCCDASRPKGLHQHFVRGSPRLTRTISTVATCVWMFISKTQQNSKFAFGTSRMREVNSGWNDKCPAAQLLPVYLFTILMSTTQITYQIQSHLIQACCMGGIFVATLFI